MIAVLLTFFVVACRKEAPAPDSSPSRNTELLTAKSWLYAECYSGYGTGNQKRVYKRGATGNVVDYSDYRYQFKKDGVFELVFGRELLYGSWKFVSNETQIEIATNSGTPTLITVRALTAETFDWAEADYFFRMIPQ